MPGRTGTLPIRGIQVILHEPMRMFLRAAQRCLTALRKVKNVLDDTRLSNPEHEEDACEIELVANIVDTEYEIL